MSQVWNHQIWIQNYLGFIVSDLTYSTYLTFVNMNDKKVHIHIKNLIKK